MEKYKVTRIKQDVSEVYDLEGYYQILHFLIDIFLFGVGNTILKIEKIEDEKPEETPGEKVS